MTAGPEGTPAAGAVDDTGDGAGSEFGGAGRRRARLAGVLGLSALGGFVLGCAVLPDGHAAPARPPAPVESPDHPPGGLPPQGGAPLPQVTGTGVLRPGDSGHGVYELQVRLLQIPHLYEGGAMTGRYDEAVRRAVALFQERYGIRGDERGVYGDNTRYALMLRTK
ncbi:peptidoglycan-binding protein [Streptomyces sp. NPDC004065]|uniref:peptidoglycan-binding domain-containing protein n=1 Tax=Streptomyces sp. NPDC004065 TaxID=3364689 RepID=UPI00384B7852